MRVDRLRDRLWRWTALHPDWEKEPDAGWDKEVACVYYEADDAVVLIDPLIPPEDPHPLLETLDREVERAAKPVAIELTIFWHERSSADLMERYGATLWADARTTDRMDVLPTNAYEPGTTLPGGVATYFARDRPECMLWIDEHRALVCGDLINGRADGTLWFRDDWLRPEVSAAGVRADLRALLDLPVELVLTAHGPPVVENAREELARVLEV